MEINIRGGLGNQVLEYLIAKADHREVTKINVGVGDTNLDWVKKVWVNKVLVLDDATITEVDEVVKYNIWNNKDNFKKITNKLTNRVLLNANPERIDETIVHVRGSDRAFASVFDYVALLEYIDNKDVKILGEDNKYIDKVLKIYGYGENISSDPVSDWYRCIGCSKLYSGFSSFTLSSVVYDPTKKYVVLDKQSMKGRVTPPDKDLECVQVLFDNHLKNSSWLSLTNKKEYKKI
jgi:hypothetical protein